MSVILGIDPGTHVAGFGVIQTDQLGALEHRDHGVILMNRRDSFADRLHLFYEQLEELFKVHQPDVVVVEDIFVGKNIQSAFRLGHLRGLCLQLAAKYQCQVVEYAAKKVKKVVTGHGGAEKDHVRLVVLNLLGIRSQHLNDATDALALSICHVRQRTSERLLQNQLGKELL
ncbi:MAG: crossover junction endodeoxyribonuclease RuvC [Bdellovibrionales bacterium]|nr:crossover junction endodeoxyribonuclease RuvC [Bdellovibrionales bacterium]